MQLHRQKCKQRIAWVSRALLHYFALGVSNTRHVCKPATSTRTISSGRYLARFQNHFITSALCLRFISILDRTRPRGGAAIQICAIYRIRPPCYLLF